MLHGCLKRQSEELKLFHCIFLNGEISKEVQWLIIFKSCCNIFKKFGLIDVQYTFDQGTMVSITGPFCSVHDRMPKLCLEVVSFLSDGEQISF